jgi:hypothetical protein
MTRPLVLLCAATLALAGCQKEQAAGSETRAAITAPATPAAATAPAASASVVAPIPGEPPLPEMGDFKIVQVLMGNTVDGEKVVVHDTREFAAKDAIYASVLSIGAHQGLKLSADWRAPDGSIIAKSVQALVPTTDLATTFQLRNSAAWPAGDYQLRLAINGHTIRNETFAVH